MARINLTQAINLTVMVQAGEGKSFPQTLELKRGVNEVAPEILSHPYIVAHMKAGSASIVPDPMDPEDIARAAEEIARRARAQAEAAKALKEAELKKVDDALAAAVQPAGTATALRTDGPTIAEFVAAGYPAAKYPPYGYASRSTAEEIAAAVDAEAKAKAAAVPAPAASAPGAAPAPAADAPQVPADATHVAPTATAAPAAAPWAAGNPALAT